MEQNTRLAGVTRWGVTPAQALLIAAIPVLTMLGMLALVRFSSVFIWVTAEDSLMEWAQFFFLLLASLLFAWLGARLVRRKQKIGYIYLLAALGVFFIAGEEIAWGQRLFGWATPEKLGEVNYQDETTIHNISTLHELFINAIMLAGLYGTLAPLALLAFGRRRPYPAWVYLLVPPLFLVPAFFMPFGYRFARLVLPLEEWFPHLVFYITKFSEITELCLYFGLAVFAWLSLRRISPGSPPAG